jgi:hypothetical protein
MGSLHLNDNLSEHHIALFLLLVFSARLLIKVFNETISIQKDVLLYDFLYQSFKMIISDDIRLPLKLFKILRQY